MPTLSHKIRHAGEHSIPALTVRRVFDHTRHETRYQVRGRIDPHSLEYLGDGRSCEEILSSCQNAGYEVDEIVAQRTWLCTLRKAR